MLPLRNPAPFLRINCFHVFWKVIGIALYKEGTIFSSCFFPPGMFGLLFREVLVEIWCRNMVIFAKIEAFNLTTNGWGVFLAEVNALAGSPGSWVGSLSKSTVRATIKVRTNSSRYCERQKWTHLSVCGTSRSFEEVRTVQACISYLQYLFDTQVKSDDGGVPSFGVVVVVVVLLLLLLLLLLLFCCCCYCCCCSQ